MKDEKGLKSKLESLYDKYNRREYVHPDPLEFLYRYSDLRDRELMGMVASALAYGRVKQIIKSVTIILDAVGPSPYLFIRESSPTRIESAFRGFVHRFATGGDISRLMIGLKGILDQDGSLHRAFEKHVRRDQQTVLPAMTRFCREITEAAGKNLGHLLPLPDRGSACKRLNLFLRWMVRKDRVDPGGWSGIPVENLIIPLDVHMHRFGQKFGFTSRKQTDMRTALEITNGFRQFSPKDPVRYDFALTRLGIRDDAGEESLYVDTFGDNYKKI